MKKMERLIRNYATTILGAGILIYCMVMLGTGTAWGDLVGFFGMSALLLRSKDSLIGLPKE